MLSYFNKINLNICFYILLVKCSTKVVAFPAERSSLSCDCVLLQSCDTFNTFIDNIPNERHIKTVIQNAVCFFDGFRIFVCCPNKLEHKQIAKERPKLDYLDELTGLNCPPSFGEEYDYDKYLEKPKNKPKYTYNSQNSYNDYDDVYTNHDEDYGPFSFPHYDHHHHHHHNMHVPFFPHTHTNHHNHDYHTEETVTQSSAKKDHNNCGMLPPVLDNGNVVYPWITRLAYLNTTSRTIRYRCMGTVISNQHVLTAAHCVDKLVPDLRLIYVRAGDETNFVDYRILETIVHPNYNEPLFNNDVAILRLSITSKNNDSLIQICLPKNNSIAMSGDTGVVAGWSSSGISEMNSSTIRYINLPIMNNTECAIRYAKYSENFESSIIITPTEFCAKAQAMNDVCEGDSGGPFMERSNSARYTLLGIVAFGPKTNCGQSNLPGVYMRVSSYVNWIKSNIQ